MIQQAPKEMFTIAGEPQVATDARRKILTTFQDLEFTEEGHIYRLHGMEIPSVTGIVEQFVREPFDCRKQATSYAERNGETPEFWMEKWNKVNFRATTLGTKTHAFGESLAYIRAGHPELIHPLVRSQYSEEYRYLAPIHPKEEAVEKFIDDMESKPYMHLVMNEARVYSGLNPDPELNLKQQICGTFDMLYYYDGNGNSSRAGFVIYDYKTNRSLQDDYSRKFGKMLKEPFADLTEESLSLYTLQLGLYGLMLEDIGFRIVGHRLVWLKDDGNFEIVKIDDLSKRLRNTL